MNRALYVALAAAAAIAVSQGMPSYAQSDASTAQKRESIYGYGMMSEQERNDYRDKMRNAASAQDRQALRDEHRKQMQDRMAQQGTQQGVPGGGRGRGMGPHGQGSGELRGPGAGMGGPGPNMGGPGMRGPRGPSGTPAAPPAAPTKGPDAAG